MSLMYEPPRQIALQVAIAWNPLLWSLWPRVGRKPPEGWRGGFSFMFLFVQVQRWWRYV